MTEVHKILIFGNSGSGKSTLAKELSGLINLPYNEVDSLRWNKDWSRIPQNTFEESLNNIILRDKWIVEDGSKTTLEYFKQQAEVIVWLKVNVLICLLRLIKRSVCRWVGRDSKAPEPFIMALKHWRHCVKYKIYKKEKLFADVMTEVSDKIIIIRNSKDRKNLINYLKRDKWEN